MRTWALRSPCFRCASTYRRPERQSTPTRPRARRASAPQPARPDRRQLDPGLRPAAHQSDPHVPQERWQSPADIEQIANEFNLAAEKAAKYGIRVGYHNQLQTLIDGKRALEVLVESLSSQVVLEVDTYRAYAGGADVPGLLKRLGERVVALHIKDGDGSLDDKKQVAVGSGSLPIWEFIDAAPNALRVVELDDSMEDMLTASGSAATTCLTRTTPDVEMREASRQHHRGDACKHCIQVSSQWGR